MSDSAKKRLSTFLSLSSGLPALSAAGQPAFANVGINDGRKETRRDVSFGEMAGQDGRNKMRIALPAFFSPSTARLSSPLSASSPS